MFNSSFKYATMTFSQYFPVHSLASLHYITLQLINVVAKKSTYFSNLLTGDLFMIS
jgi:hypothetical protein